MKNKELFKGLNKARKEFNNWQGKAVIFIDFDDMDAWCRVQDIPRYHSENIVALIGKDDLYERNNRYGEDRLKQLASAKLEKFNQGFTKIDLEDDHFFAEYLY